MITKPNLKDIAVRTLQIEADSLKGLINFIDDNFVNCVHAIYESKGRVIVSGIGKSAIVAAKIVATLNSTGTPAIFMHAADAIHGDLGIIQKDDVVILISKSGNTPEIKVLVPLLRQAGNKLIGLVGNIDSYLVKNVELILNTSVEKEACPHNLAPTSSSIAQMAIGDALAVCLLELRGFTSDDFARYHPGGALGKRLYLRVADIISYNPIPAVALDSDLKTVILEISAKRLGATAVMQNDRLAGLITDGDLRRMMEKDFDLKNIKAADIMTANPKYVHSDTLAVDALHMMKQHNITQLLVMDGEKLAGFVHLHDLVREGII